MLIRVDDAMAHGIKKRALRDCRSIQDEMRYLIGVGMKEDDRKRARENAE